jgi:hypothetical protein
MGNLKIFVVGTKIDLREQYKSELKKWKNSFIEITNHAKTQHFKDLNFYNKKIKNKY